MQSASSNFTQEASGGQVTWAKPRVFADWAGDGYGVAGSIDDLSDQVGDTFSVEHHLDDGLPWEVSQPASGAGPTTVTLPLAYGRGNRASTYFSPYNTTSPVSGFDRDVAPVKLDWGLVTAAGQEYIRLFTGQMTNLKTAGQGAELQAMSATRLRLARLVHPPAVDGDERGMNGSWPVSYALAQCGVYVSPPARSGTRWHNPMHGSLQPFRPTTNDVSGQSLEMFSKTTGGGSQGAQIRPKFITGPYLLGADCAVTATEARFISGGVLMGSGADIFSKAGNRGRIEFWVKGDPANFNTAPGGSGDYPSRFVDIVIQNTGGTYVKCGIQASDRKVVFNVNDGATVWSVTTAAALPTDGNWYPVGVAWKIDTGSMAVREFDGTVSFYGPSPVTTNLPATESFAANFPTLQSFLPIAEVQISSGSDGWTDTPWLADAGWWTPGVIMRPSMLELAALAETAPREAWELIGSFAQAELAMMRTDELDLFNYLPMSYWAEPAQQTVVDAISTSRNAQDIDVNLDPTKIRNSVRVTFSETRIEPTFAEVLTLWDTRSIPPGLSTLVMALDKPAVGINRQTLLNASAADVLAGDGKNVTINSAADGTGTYRTSSEVSITVTDWTAGAVFLTVQNNTGSTQYFANNGNLPTMRILGSAANTLSGSVTGQDAASIARRGERALALNMPTIQSRDNAQAIADELAWRLSKARPSVGDYRGIPLFADPRRQPGDLITLDDSVNTGASGLWRIQSITHNRDGADYTQQATIQHAFKVGVWDDPASLWDDCLWGP